jgi:hypothetical protein
VGNFLAMLGDETLAVDDSFVRDDMLSGQPGDEFGHGHRQPYDGYDQGTPLPHGVVSEGSE